MRVPHCDQWEGVITTIGGQDTVRCIICNTWLYNAPRTETGRDTHSLTERNPHTMSNTPTWEEVEVPRGAYVGWGTQTGQHVTGKVLDYSPVNGRTVNGEPCPQVSIELTEPAASFNKEGARTDFPAGELIVLNASQASLKRAVQAAALNVGDLVKITFSGTYKAEKGTGKEFSIKVARGAGRSAAPAQPATGFDSTPQAAPPF
jgi:hypothetical protein